MMSDNGLVVCEVVVVAAFLGQDEGNLLARGKAEARQEPAPPPDRVDALVHRLLGLGQPHLDHVTTMTVTWRPRDGHVMITRRPRGGLHGYRDDQDECWACSSHSTITSSFAQTTCSSLTRALVARPSSFLTSMSSSRLAW